MTVEQSKIDAIVNKMLDGIREKNRGFMLDLAGDARAQLAEVRDAFLLTETGGDPAKLALALDKLEDAMARTSISVVESLPPVDEWQRPADLRLHRIFDTDSLVAYAKKYGNQDTTLILYSETSCTLTINELVERGDRETITMPFDLSEDFAKWRSAIGAELQHRDMVKFLIAHEHNLVDPTIIMAMRRIRATSTVNIESDVHETEGTVGIMLKSNGGEELAKFPKKWDVRLPVLDQDIDEAEWRTIHIRLEIIMPTKPDEGPKFCLRCPEMAMLLRQRVADEGAKIREALPGWNIMHGLHHTVTRNIGADR